MSGISYRKKYEKLYGKLQDGWNIHHIDWNRQNNDLENLVAVPEQLHHIINAGRLEISREQIHGILKYCGEYFNIQTDIMLLKKLNKSNKKYKEFLTANNLTKKELSFKDFLNNDYEKKP